MNTYTASKDGGAGGRPDANSREWVFGLLGTPLYRERITQLQAVDLLRRPGCEPCLRALVLDAWTPETLHHLGWCDSCRAAAISLGRFGPAGQASWVRRRASWLAVAAFAAVAVPLAGSQVLDQGSQVGARGGLAIVTKATAPGTTTPGAATTPAKTGSPGITVTPVARSKRFTAVRETRSGTSGAAKKPLPVTT